MKTELEIKEEINRIESELIKTRAIQQADEPTVLTMWMQGRLRSLKWVLGREVS